MSGSGGEFLNIKISEHSGNNYFKQSYVKSGFLNRYKITNGFFHNAFGNPYIHSKYNVLDASELYNSIPEANRLNLTKLYEERVNALHSGQIGLCRTHILHHCMNSSNTWYVYADTEEMRDYSYKLATIKILFDIENQNGIKSSISDQSLIDSVLEKMNSMNLSTIEYSRIVMVMKGVYTLDQAFNCDMSDVVKYYKEHRLFTDKSRYVLPDFIDKSRVINMSDILIPGYIEDMFNISSNAFNDELCDWNTRNLQLIELYEGKI
jgi:hypothetical protein